jgi:hypothetical protein
LIWKVMEDLVIGFFDWAKDVVINKVKKNNKNTFLI